YSMFHILNDYSLGLWKQQVSLLIQNHGLISFITHPDYLIEKRARGVYCQLLDYLRQIIDHNQIWAPLPGEVNRWWRARSKMKLVQREGGWKIEGPESERATLAYAVLDGEDLRYEFSYPSIHLYLPFSKDSEPGFTRVRPSSCSVKVCP